MTEQEWFACDSPEQMIIWLKGKVSDRKLRLFAVACCRRIWHLLQPEISQRGVETIERFADGQATEEELAEVHRRADRYGRQAYKESQRHTALSSESELAYRDSEQAHAVADAVGVDEHSLAMMLIHATQCAVRERISGCQATHDLQASQDWYRLVGADRAQQSALLREIIGNPFRPIMIHQAWLAWEGGTIPKLAGAIYEERRFSDLPVLADALEEAGSCEQSLLSHCRQPAEHARGCWALDLILGKE